MLLSLIEGGGGNSFLVHILALDLLGLNLNS